ncbi:methionine--tRNA ligase [Candidatus Gottesmanbacteria bacterium RIFCSPHIGHO2_01_FULL_46_14]|uniref:Methionine--tRNA ligase n=2 Tax=Candidatus Gottesmaniibacteriota TaxID=1752720 RepID=A0A1F5ZRD9_9BACT|nr:MAG: methionine--tRNA ligase [Candidatus Gottesmanbacteria bacterium RIFCSPHIGHO2_01_FULL_46_14]OGG30337.1 MAG: methionine--tRNA ligase [Candidatus Gottesmanbacteria bacterium RIFCSPLOWO2_01_FULL_46_21]
MTNKFYLHSAIPYVNAAPHIGHAQEFIYSDVIRRYHKLLHEDVLYLCGADENGLKIIQAAQKAGVEPHKFCDIHQQEFLDLAKKLNVHFDIWQRGTNENHFLSSQKLWELCTKSGDIYKKSYEGLYCVGCEAFYTSDELNENGECFEHPGKKLDLIAEKNYFFRLSKYQKFFEELIISDALSIIPQSKKNETVAFIKKGLEDFSISRTKERAKGWGVPVPGDPDQIMYVWFDANNIYYSGIGLGWNDELFTKWAPADLMIIGKGILRFHAIYWPAVLKSAGLPLPKQLFVHGYLTVDGQKMSKTVGNVVDPIKVLNQYGTDAVRYYLTREIPSYSDGDYSERRFKELYNADLANGLGNLVARIAKLAESQKCKMKNVNFQDVNTGEYKKALEEYRFNDALAYVWERVKTVDKFINENQPWKLSGNDLIKVLDRAISQIIEIATLLQPFLPQTAQKILEQFRGPTILSQPSLFPRL